MPNPNARVLLIPESYPGAQTLVGLGSLKPAPVPGSGMAKWTEVDRGRKRSLPRYDGESLTKITFSVLLDQWPDGDVTAIYERIFGWAAIGGLPRQPTVLRTIGPLPFSWLRWVLNNVEQMDDVRRRDDGVLAFAELKLELMEYNEWAVPGDKAGASKSPAFAAEYRARISRANDPRASTTRSTTAAPAPPRTYTVSRGDTLSAIAARLLGNANRWKEIADLNGVRDPRKLAVGQLLRLP